MTMEMERRGFLKFANGAAALTLLGFHVGRADAVESSTANSAFSPNAFIRMDDQGMVTLVMPQQEMGQGIYTGHAQVLAEEMDIPLSMVQLVAAPADDSLYGGPRKRQGTGGSSSMRGGLYNQLRQAGADAKAMLLEAAAMRLGVPVGTLQAEDGIINARSGESTTYRDVAADAARIRLRAPGGLKSPDNFKLIGKPVQRLDMPAKVNGSAEYGIDVFAGEIRVAAVAPPPTLGAKVQGVTPADLSANEVPGLERIIVMEDLVAAVASNSWAAFEALNQLQIDWIPGPYAQVDQARIEREQDEAASKSGALALEAGDSIDASATDWELEADYVLPFVCHAPMEPLNCTVHVTVGGCEVWMGTQVQTGVQRAAAGVLGLPPESVVLHNYMLGGAFGRRLDTDMVVTAVRVGKEMGVPVKVIWSREEDFRQDTVRPLYHNRMAATLRDGKIDKWLHRVTAGVIPLRMGGKLPEDGVDRGSVDGATELPYAIPNQRVEFVHQEPNAVNLGWWRGVGPNSTVFAIESFIDELARDAGRDPVEFRLEMLADTPRLAAVLDIAAKKSGWGTQLPRGQGRGVCAFHAFGSYVASVAEVQVSDEGVVAVRRFTSAVDCGTAINPDLVLSQFEGGTTYGLSAALYEKITVEAGGVAQSNFNSYRIMRMSEAPDLDLHIVPSTEPPGGVGEPPTTSAAPALANAIASATGIRIRTLPIKDHDLSRSNWQ